MSEVQVLTKVEELIRALDQVKRYRALTRLLVDFAVIFLASVAVLLGWELGFDFYRLGSPTGCYYAPFSELTCTASSAALPLAVQLFSGLAILLIPMAGLLGGIAWVDGKLKKVEVEGWKGTLGEGIPGAIKLLQELDWDSVVDDIRASRSGYSVYFTVKVAGYWMLAFVVLFFPYVVGMSALHLAPNMYALALVSFVLVVLLARGDLQKKYRQAVSLDNLMWELRWFSGEFKAAKFEA